MLTRPAAAAAAAAANVATRHGHMRLTTPPPAGPTFWAALFGIAIDQSPWQYMLSMRQQGYGGVTKVPLGPFGGDFFFGAEVEV